MVSLGGGVLYGWAPVPRILELLYPGREPPAFESRDMAWGLAFLIMGVVLIVWSAAQMLGRRPVMSAGQNGVDLFVRGPFARPLFIPWDEIGGISAGTLRDGNGDAPVLSIEVVNPDRFPSNLWGARWSDAGVLSIMAKEWTPTPAVFAESMLKARSSAQEVSPIEDEETDLGANLPQSGSDAEEGEDRDPMVPESEEASTPPETLDNEPKEPDPEADEGDVG